MALPSEGADSAGRIFRRIWDPVFVLKGILSGSAHIFVPALGLITVLWLTVLPSMDEIAAAGTLDRANPPGQLRADARPGRRFAPHRIATRSNAGSCLDTKPMRKGPQYTFGVIRSTTICFGHWPGACSSGPRMNAVCSGYCCKG